MAEATKGRVLVVDDELGVRHSLALVLAQSGFEPVPAESVRAALALYEKDGADLLLVDKNLPGESGVDLIRGLRAHGDMVPVILMTAFGSVDSAIQSLHLRVSAYIEKPFDDIFAVAALVEQTLNRGRPSSAVPTTGAIDHFRKAKAALQDASAVSAGERSVRILVVTADAADRNAVGRWLARADDVVEHCQSAALGFAAVAARAPDLVLVDEAVTSPDIFSFIEQLRVHAVRSVWIAITLQPSLSTVMRLMRLEVRAILEKPLDGRQVHERLDPIMQQLRRGGGA